MSNSATRARKAVLPPGPRGRLLNGTVEVWRENPLRAMTELVREFGPAVRFHYALGRYGHLFTHPDHYQRILQDNYRNYTKQHPVYAGLAVALGRGLVTLDGEPWKRHRRLMQPSFHRSRMPAVADLVVRRTDEMLARWQLEGASPRAPLALAVDREMMQLTLDVVGEALLGTSLATHAAVIGRQFTAFSEQMVNVTMNPIALLTVKFPLLPTTRKLHAAARRLRQVVDDIIHARRQGQNDPGTNDDLLGQLLSARDEESGQRLSDADVRDEVMTLMLAGHETSAAALTWTFALISANPEVEATLREELERVLASRAPSWNDLDALPYVRAVAQEAMRLYPPVYAFDRRSIEPDHIGGFDIPAGAFLSLCPYLTHRMPEFWDQPARFAPERFLPGARRVPKFAYIPFSAGPRQCIGAGFAMTEIQLVLARVLQRYRLRVAPGVSVEPWPGITLRPRGGLPMLAEPVE